MRTKRQKIESAKKAVSKPFMTVSDVANLCQVGYERAKKILEKKKVECVEGLYQTDLVIKKLNLSEYVERLEKTQ